MCQKMLKRFYYTLFFSFFFFSLSRTTKIVRVSRLIPFEKKEYVWCLNVPPRCSKAKVTFKVGYEDKVIFISHIVFYTYISNIETLIRFCVGKLLFYICLFYVCVYSAEMNCILHSIDQRWERYFHV